MPSKKPLRRLEDILDNIARIERFTAGMDFATFSANEQALYASLHALLIISEAARTLGNDAETFVPGQPWPAIAALGNILRHEYDGVDPQTVWRIISTGDLTALRDAVSASVTKIRADQA